MVHAVELKLKTPEGRANPSGVLLSHTLFKRGLFFPN